MHEFRTLDSVRLTLTLSVSYLRFSISPLYLAPEVPEDEGGGAGDDAGADAGAGAGDPEPTFDFCSFELFSCSTSFFHLLTSSEAARAISLLAFDLSLPTKTPALVACKSRITVLVDCPNQTKKGDIHEISHVEDFAKSRQSEQCDHEFCAKLAICYVLGVQIILRSSYPTRYLTYP